MTMCVARQVEQTERAGPRFGGAKHRAKVSRAHGATDAMRGIRARRAGAH